MKAFSIRWMFVVSVFCFVELSAFDPIEPGKNSSKDMSPGKHELAIKPVKIGKLLFVNLLSWNLSVALWNGIGKRQQKISCGWISWMSVKLFSIFISIRNCLQCGRERSERWTSVKILWIDEKSSKLSIHLSQSALHAWQSQWRWKKWRNHRFSATFNNHLHFCIFICCWYFYCKHMYLYLLFPILISYVSIQW